MNKAGKIAVGFCYFNAVSEIERALDPIAKNVDLIIAIDGRFNGFKWSSNYSKDGGPELIEKKYPNTILKQYAGEQVKKRQMYLDIAGEEGCDWLMVFDSDDYIHPDWQDWDFFYTMLEWIGKERKDECYIGMWAWIKKEWQKNWNQVVDNMWWRYYRVIKNPGEMKYHLNHYDLVKKDDPTEKYQFGSLALEGVRFTADSLLRTDAFKQAGFDWAYWNSMKENKNIARQVFDKYLVQFGGKDTKPILNKEQEKLQERGFIQCSHCGIMTMFPVRVGSKNICLKCKDKVIAMGQSL